MPPGSPSPSDRSTRFPFLVSGFLSSLSLSLFRWNRPEKEGTEWRNPVVSPPPSRSLRRARVVRVPRVKRGIPRFSTGQGSGSHPIRPSDPQREERPTTLSLSPLRVGAGEGSTPPPPFRWRGRGREGVAAAAPLVPPRALPSPGSPIPHPRVPIALPSPRAAEEEEGGGEGGPLVEATPSPARVPTRPRAPSTTSMSAWAGAAPRSRMESFRTHPEERRGRGWTGRWS